MHEASGTSDAGARLWRTPSLIVSPGGAGRAAEITDQTGSPLATYEPDGTLHDAAGVTLAVATLRRPKRPDRPLEVAVDVADPGGRALGSGRVVKYGLGPRARKATIAIDGPDGAETARIEPRDKHGSELAVTTDGATVATIEVSTVKRGFLRKSRVYGLDVVADIPDEVRRLVLATALRYDAVLDAVAAASMRD